MLAEFGRHTTIDTLNRASEYISSLTGQVTTRIVQNTGARINARLRLPLRRKPCSHKATGISSKSTDPTLITIAQRNIDGREDIPLLPPLRKDGMTV
jgi:hypothetical protein